MTKLTPEQDAAARAYAARQQANSPAPAPRVALTPDEQARIRAEEAYRAQVRGEVAQQAMRQNPPSYWLGFWLNALIFGLGFLVIGEWAWAVIWLLAAVALNLMTSFIAWPVLAVLVLVHYRAVYARKYT